MYVTNAQWAILKPVLVAVTGQRRKAHRTFLNAALSVLNGGHSWRDLDPSFGSWNTNYVKFRRWAATGIWDELLPVLVSLKMTTNWKVSFEDSKGFATTTRIIVNQARTLSDARFPSDTIAGQVRYSENALPL
jgi:transposase